MIVDFIEESDYGQDVLDLAGLTALLMDESHSIGEIRDICRRITGKCNMITSKLTTKNDNYWKGWSIWEH